jgi:hypothetical protein
MAATYCRCIVHIYIQPSVSVIKHLWIDMNTRHLRRGHSWRQRWGRNRIWTSLQRRSQTVYFVFIYVLSIHFNHQKRTTCLQRTNQMNIYCPQCVLYLEVPHAGSTYQASNSHCNIHSPIKACRQVFTPSTSFGLSVDKMSLIKAHGQ